MTSPRPFVIPPHGDPPPTPTPAEVEAAIAAAREATRLAHEGKRLTPGTTHVQWDEGGG